MKTIKIIKLPLPTEHHKGRLWSSFVGVTLANRNKTPATEKDVVLSGTIPHLEFTLEIQSNNLTYQSNQYTEYQQFLYTLIKSLHDKRQNLPCKD